MVRPSRPVMWRMISVSRPFSVVSVVTRRSPHRRLPSRRDCRGVLRRCCAPIPRAAVTLRRAHQLFPLRHQRRGGGGNSGGGWFFAQSGGKEKLSPPASLLRGGRKPVC